MVALDPTGINSLDIRLLRGVAWKEPVRCATTANITLSGTQTIDGIAAVAEDRVLVKNQTAGAGNGLYVVKAGAWLRAYDMDQDATTTVQSSEVMGAVVLVLLGTVNAGTIWKNTNATVPVLGTTALTFASFFSALSLALDDLTDVTITSATTADRLRYNGSAWVNSALIWRPAMVLDPTSGNYLPVTASGDAVMTEA